MPTGAFEPFPVMKRIAVISLLALLFGGNASGQSDRQLVRDGAGPRTALVIGNGNYASAPLRNPVNDASDVAAALKSLGFEVLSHTDLDQNGMKRAIRDFGTKLRTKGGVGLFYYAGHGVQVKGINYLIPVGTEVGTEEEVEYESVEAGLVLAQMEAAKNDINIVILDACRNNPFARSYRSVDKGLAQINAPSGTLIAYSTAPGSIASDGTGRNGLYTQEFLKQIKTPGRTIEDVFKQIRVAVRSVTGGTQTPWESSSLTGEFFFNRSGVPNPGRIIPDGSTDSTARLFRRVENSIGVELRPIPPGEFKMGSPDSRETSPVRTVKLGEFWMSTHEITIGQWKKVMGEMPGELLRGDAKLRRSDNQPVVYVSWTEARQFIERLNQTDKFWTYRLPTEAEWEYACRAGTTTYYSFGNDIAVEQANYDPTMSNSEQGTTRETKSYPWNQFGLYDMHGNVWEWVEDAYSANYAGLPTDGTPNPGTATETRKVFRGGSWANDPHLLRSDMRRSGGPSLRDGRVGFRIVAVQKFDSGATGKPNSPPASARLPLNVSESMFTFALEKCTRSGSMVMCSLTITNDDKIDRKLEVPFPDSANGRTFDDQGNQSELDSWQIGQTAKREATLIPGVRVSAVVRFKGVSPQASILKRIDLGFRTAFSEGGYYKRRDVIVRFTDVPL